MLGLTMYADAAFSEASASGFQRADGRARVSFRRRGGRTALGRLFQEGAARLRFPAKLDGVPEAVLINTAGGLTGGDRFSVAIAVDEGCRAVATTQACERIYRSAGGAAEVSARLDVAAGGRLDWLPQETILFDGGRLRRRLEAELAPDATLLAVEAVIFGRRAMGETVTSGSLRDRWRIRRGGRLVFAEDLCFEGPIAELTARRAVLGGGAAMATLLFVGPEPERLLEPLREILGESGGASAWEGKLVARIAAPDGLALRRRLIPALRLLAGRPLPKVWQL